VATATAAISCGGGGVGGGGGGGGGGGADDDDMCNMASRLYSTLLYSTQNTLVFSFHC